MLYYDPTFLLLIPALIFGIWAQLRVSSSFKKYSKVPSMLGLTGAQAARRLLDQAGLHSVAIEGIPGNLTDHYDPRAKVLRLTAGVGQSNSLAALGIAAHEAGHALQDAEGYAFMRIRTSLVPVANLGSSLLFPLLIGGFLFNWGILIRIGIVLYSAAVLFHIVTLPVEFNASSRAVAYLENYGILRSEELPGAKKVLKAAALTYVAAMLASVLQLIRLLILSRDR
jgi:uncharacterized protein